MMGGELHYKKAFDPQPREDIATILYATWSRSRTVCGLPKQMTRIRRHTPPFAKGGEGWGTRRRIGYLQRLGLNSSDLLGSCPHGSAPILFATRLAHHLEARYLQMSVLGVGLLDAGVGRRCLGVFLHIVRLGIRDHTFQSYGVTHMLRKIHGSVAVSFPGTAIFGGKQKFVSAVAL